jgi:hypothetical protein
MPDAYLGVGHGVSFHSHDPNFKGSALKANQLNVKFAIEVHRRMRLLGFQRVELQPGESQQVTVTADPRLLARFEGEAGQWAHNRRQLPYRAWQGSRRPGPDGRGTPDGKALW